MAPETLSSIQQRFQPVHHVAPGAAIHFGVKAHAGDRGEVRFRIGEAVLGAAVEYQLPIGASGWAPDLRLSPPCPSPTGNACAR